MGAVDTMIDRMKRIDMSVIINNAVRKHETEILKWNYQDQLYNKGIGGDGMELKPPYRQRTIELKQSRTPKQPTDRVTLRDTGTFHESIEIQYLTNMIVFHSNNLLRSKLIGKYGRDIFGLTEQNVEKLKDLIFRDIQQELLNV